MTDPTMQMTADAIARAAGMTDPIVLSEPAARRLADLRDRTKAAIQANKAGATDLNDRAQHDAA